MIQFEVLGPVNVLVDGVARPIRPRVRALLGLMLLEPNRPWTSDVLADHLWHGAPPKSADAALRVHLAQLRQALREHTDGTSRLVTTPYGYVVVVEPGELDVIRLDETLDSRSTDELGDVLRGWDGDAFAGLDDIAPVVARRAHLSQRRADAVVQWAELLLAAGRHHEW